MPNRGDIVAFNPTPALVRQNFKDPFIFRVIGLPGETVEVKRNDGVYINGERLEENYILELPQYSYEPVNVTENFYLVLGDDRNNSYDSHYWGFVEKNLILGKIIGIFCPVERQQILSSEDLTPEVNAVFHLFTKMTQAYPQICSISTQSKL